MVCSIFVGGRTTGMCGVTSPAATYRQTVAQLEYPVPWIRLTTCLFYGDGWVSNGILSW